MIRISFLVLSLFLNGCSIKDSTLHSNAYHIMIKNHQFAINDTGFLIVKSHTKELQVFSAASPILDLHVEDQKVCVNSTCTNKKYFNKEFFGAEHYDNLLADMILFKPIYEGKNLQKFQDGFEQKIVSSHYDILYRVQDGKLYFKDKTNRVLIKFNKLGE